MLFSTRSNCELRAASSYTTRCGLTPPFVNDPVPHGSDACPQPKRTAKMPNDHSSCVPPCPNPPSQRQNHFHAEDDEFEFCSSRFDLEDLPLSPTPLSAASSPYTHHHIINSQHFDLLSFGEAIMIASVTSGKVAGAAESDLPTLHLPPKPKLPPLMEREPSQLALSAHLPPRAPYSDKKQISTFYDTPCPAPNLKNTTDPAPGTRSISSLLRSSKERDESYYSHSSSSSRNSASSGEMDGNKISTRPPPHRRAANTYARHYGTPKRPHNGELHRKTFLPYKQNLLGCWGCCFSSSAGDPVNIALFRGPVRA